MNQQSLLDTIRRVNEFEMDPGVKSLTFADRLARENGWSLEFANRVITEYKRFCVLAMHAGHPVTPSEQVDQAWHLHLTYTRSYWERFCGEALGRPLHHEPTAGGKAEGKKFRDWYSKTLESYRHVFRDEPPRDIWPTPRERFHEAGSWQWINTSQVWVIRKSHLLTIVAAMAASVMALVIAGCQPIRLSDSLATMHSLPVASIPPFNSSGETFLIIYALLGMTALGTVLFIRLRKNRELLEHPVDPSSLSIYHLAVLAGGTNRLMQLALTQLYSRSRLRIQEESKEGHGLQVQGDRPTQRGPAQALYDHIQTSSSTDLADVVVPYYEKLVRDLESMRLRYASVWCSGLSIVIVLSVFAIGIVRVIQGILVDQPIGILLALIVLFVFAGAILCVRFDKNTIAGSNVLAERKKDLPLESPPNIGTGDGSVSIASGSNDRTQWMGVALWGGLALASMPEYEAFQQSLRKIPGATSTSSSSGCGTGCGTGGATSSGDGGGGDGGGDGGCGGGCGGCGGCGG